jgi:beta-xylosidase
MRVQFVSFALASTLAGATIAQSQQQTPVIMGSWLQIAGNPNLGVLTGAQQQPVDFSIWQAADGTWQLWSCIRFTNCGGFTRLFHRWEGTDLKTANWTPMGIAMMADPALGEQLGGLQAPHVVRHDGVWYMVYGDFVRICLARSFDGKNFTRVLNDNGQPNLFEGPYLNTRDPMLLRLGGLWLCYYCGSQLTAPYYCAVFCRTSADLKYWSEPMFVCAGGTASSPAHFGDAECPFVLQRGSYFYMFRNQIYGPAAQNTQYGSRDPFNFGVGHDRYRIGTLPVAAPEIVFDNGKYFIAALNPNLDGIRIARMHWTP